VPTGSIANSASCMFIFFALSVRVSFELAQGGFYRFWGFRLGNIKIHLKSRVILALDLVDLHHFLNLTVGRFGLKFRSWLPAWPEPGPVGEYLWGISTCAQRERNLLSGVTPSEDHPNYALLFLHSFSEAIASLADYEEALSEMNIYIHIRRKYIDFLTASVTLCRVCYKLFVYT
jgi:hypothetical protein